MLDLEEKVQYVKGVGPTRAQLLNKLGIFTLEDLITYYPRDYEDRGKTRKIITLQDGEEVLIEAIAVSKISERRIRKNMSIQNLIVRDDSGSCVITWFNQSYLKNKFILGRKYKFYGKVSNKFGKIEMSSPVFDDANDSKNTGKIIPIYPLTYKLSQNTIRQVIENGLKIVNENKSIEETLPDYLIEEYKLKNIYDAINQIHFPKDFNEFEEARRRLVFEELLTLQIALIGLKNKYKKDEKGIQYSKDVKMSDVINDLPFKLTKAQLRVLEEIDADMESYRPMNRLLQGDVGSRKNDSIYNSSI